MCELHRTNAIPFGSRISGHLCKFWLSPEVESLMGSAPCRSKWGGRAEQPEGSANGRSGHPAPVSELATYIFTQLSLPHAACYDHGGIGRENR